MPRREHAPARRGVTTMGIIAWIVLGVIAGFLTNLIMDSKRTGPASTSRASSLP
jgi:hypothetical protein